MTDQQALERMRVAARQFGAQATELQSVTANILNTPPPAAV
ncbi:MAG: hypothetical protein NTZ05_01905 [Chloroflexi bacterium]|nr:hypothetical protein [Chloroflexota bacterium]